MYIGFGFFSYSCLVIRHQLLFLHGGYTFHNWSLSVWQCEMRWHEKAFSGFCLIQRGFPWFLFWLRLDQLLLTNSWFGLEDIYNNRFVSLVFASWMMIAFLRSILFDLRSTATSSHAYLSIGGVILWFMFVGVNFMIGMSWWCIVSHILWYYYYYYKNLVLPISSSATATSSTGKFVFFPSRRDDIHYSNSYSSSNFLPRWENQIRALISFRDGRTKIAMNVLFYATFRTTSTSNTSRG